MKFALLNVLLPFTIVGCTIYKSSDRDSFNQNALAGAPASFAKATGADECWIALESASRVDLDTDRERVMVQEGFLLCSFLPTEFTSESRALVVRESELIGHQKTLQ